MLCFLNTHFNGLVPCKLLRIADGEAIVRVTASRGAYQRGEVLAECQHQVWPRSHTRKSRQYLGRHYCINHAPLAEMLAG